MRRTQIQLDEKTHELVRAEAFRRGVSIAALVREALDEHLGLQPVPRWRIEDFKSVASGRSEPSPFDPISENHDAALAEDLWREHHDPA